MSKVCYNVIDDITIINNIIRQVDKVKRILCIGHASYDVTIPFEGYPIENTKNRVTEKIECGGGPASNAAYLLGKWAMDTTFVGVLGNDLYGKRIIEEFNKVNVNTRYIELDNNRETTLSFIIVNKDTGSRTILTHRSPEMKIKGRMKIKADIILVDGQELEASFDAIKNNPRAITVIDAGTLKDETVALSKVVKYIVCSRNFAEDFSKIKIDLDKHETINEVYQKMEAEFKNNIIITLEDKGCLYKINGKIKLMPSIKVKAVDSTGAGDLFHGAFVYGLANGFNLEKTLKIANITGALSVTRLGGRYSAFSFEEVMRVYSNDA